MNAGDIDLATANGRLQARITGAVARHESEHKAERLRAKHEELAERGRWSGGPCPYGYQPAMKPGTAGEDYKVAIYVRGTERFGPDAWHPPHRCRGIGHR